MDSIRSGRWVTAGVVAVLACVLVLSRTLLAPAYLYFFDSVNFALALEDFNPALHQPQPPGYPLFVLLAKAIFQAFPYAQQTFVVTGILAAAAAMLLTWWLGKAMFNPRVGACAVLLLLFNPPFWFGALTNQVRVFLAVGGAAITFAAFRALTGPSTRWFYAGSAMLGALAGFRPEMLLFGMPLLVYAGLRTSRSVRNWIVAALLCLLTALPWVLVVLRETGGLATYMRLLLDYSNDQFRWSSVAFGAKVNAASRMALTALIWYGVPVLTWVFAAPFARGVMPMLRGRGALLAAAILPAFLFHASIHVGDPDHTLFAVPALCVLGGLILSATRWTHALTATAVVLNVLVFFFPPKGIAQACSYAAVHQIDRITRDTISAIRRIQRTGPVTLVSYDHQISWRHLYYYFPDVPILVLRQDPMYPVIPESAWLLKRRQVHQPEVAGSEIVLPPGRSIWLLSGNRGMHRLLEQSIRVKNASPVVYAETQPGMRFQFGQYRFVTSGLSKRVSLQPLSGTEPPAGTRRDPVSQK